LGTSPATTRTTGGINHSPGRTSTLRSVEDSPRSPQLGLRRGRRRSTLTPITMACARPAAPQPFGLAKVPRRRRTGVPRRSFRHPDPPSRSERLPITCASTRLVPDPEFLDTRLPTCEQAPIHYTGSIVAQHVVEKGFHIPERTSVALMAVDDYPARTPRARITGVLPEAVPGSTPPRRPPGSTRGDTASRSLTQAVGATAFRSSPDPGMSP
jgi:hypothetical protein